MSKIKNCINFFIFSLLLFVSDAYAQSDNESKTQFFDQKFKIIKNSLIHNDTAMFRMAMTTPVRVKKTNGDTVFIQLNNFGEVDVAANRLLNTVKSTNQSFYCLISEGSDKLRFTDFDISPLIIPLKIRPALDNNPLQFVGDVAIGPYLGYQIGTKSFDNSTQVSQTALTFCLFGSPTMINLHPGNQSDSTLTSSSVLGISAGAGILFDVNNIQFGIVGGVDWISGTLSQTWNYQGKPWASFSFAYNLSNQ